MPDTLSPSQRSERMRLITGKNTKPEMVVRRAVFGMGYRYRLHVKGLPGRPDIVLPRHRKIIFVHGCFWHRHANCRKARLPKSKLDYWLPKLEANRRRDKRHESHLRKMGWDVLVVWECQVDRLDALARRLRDFLG